MRLVYWLVLICFLAIVGSTCNSPQDAYTTHFALLSEAFKGKVSKEKFIQKARVGHLLFFDTKLSINNSKSCASCHNPDLYFTDGYKKTLGAYADIQLRNTPSIINSVFFKSMNWANPNITTFQQQMQVPLFSKMHFEMGMQANDTAPLKNIFSQKIYVELQIPLPKTWVEIVECISAYCSLIISRESRYDSYKNGRHQLTAIEQAGEQFFFQKLQCNACHGGVDFNIPVHDSLQFGNIQLHTLMHYAAAEDKGLESVTKKLYDRGKYRIPSLRNVCETAPYGHDGTMPTIKSILSLPHHNNFFFTNPHGHKHPQKINFQKSI
jgi:cytochrome c peroxidase